MKINSVIFQLVVSSLFLLSFNLTAEKKAVGRQNEVRIDVRVMDINESDLDRMGIMMQGMPMTYKVCYIGTSENQCNGLLASLEMLAHSNRARILSSPIIRMEDGKSATINVGESCSALYNPADIKLTVNPKIRENREIELQIMLTISSQSDAGADGQLHTSSTDTETLVRVRGGETVVLGGLSGSKSRDMSTVMFLTPSLVKKDSQMEPELSEYPYEI
ncbi:MAG: hypothetical protein PHW04_14680 [Candidatus Wallbacteria bacterium]|nr:hypothetical protein [Candidatus Wallbacteria bacterium]